MLAEACYRESLRRDSGDIRANTALGVMLLKRAQFGPAADCFEKALARDGTSGPARYYLGQARLGLGQADKAESELARAGYDFAYYSVSNLYLACLSARYARCGLYGKAAAALEMEGGSDTPLLLYHLAWCRHMQGDSAATRDALSRARGASAALCFPSQCAHGLRGGGGCRQHAGPATHRTGPGAGAPGGEPRGAPGVPGTPPCHSPFHRRYWVEANLALGDAAMQRKDCAAVLDHYMRVRAYPDNLEVKAQPGVTYTRESFKAGTALEGLGRAAEADSLRELALALDPIAQLRAFGPPRAGW